MEGGSSSSIILNIKLYHMYMYICIYIYASEEICKYNQTIDIIYVSEDGGDMQIYSVNLYYIYGDVQKYSPVAPFTNKD